MNPGNTEVNGDVDATDNPKALGIVGTVVHEAEYDGEDNTSEVSSSTSKTRHNTVGVAVNVGNETKVGTVACLEEDGHQGNEWGGGVLVVRVDLADDDAHKTSNDADKVDPQLLRPQIAVCCDVDPVSDETSKRTRDNIEEAEHGCPATRLCLAEVGEVLEVVCAEDGVDGKLGTERVEVAEGEHGRLWGQDNLHCLLEGRLLDDLVLVAVDDLNVASSGLNVAILGSDVLLLVERRWSWQ